MTVPSKESFEEYIALTQNLGKRVEGVLGSGWSRRRKFSTERETVREVITTIHDCMSALHDDLQRSSVGRWLDNPAAKKAFMRLLGEKKPQSVKPKTPDQVIQYADRLFDRWTRIRTRADLYIYQVTDVNDDGTRRTRLPTDDEINERLERVNDDWEIERVIEGNLERMSEDHPFLRVERGLGAALLGYFYTNAYTHYAVKARDRQDAAAKLLQSLHVIDDPLLWRNSGVERRGIVRSSRTHFERIVSELRASVQSDAKPIIKKIDETASRRALVYELWSLFHPINGGRYTQISAAIYHLMSMEGIDTPASPDAVGEMIKGWQSEGVHPRKLPKLGRFL